MAGLKSIGRSRPGTLRVEHLAQVESRYRARSAQGRTVESAGVDRMSVGECVLNLLRGGVVGRLDEVLAGEDVVFRTRGHQRSDSAGWNAARVDTAAQVDLHAFEYLARQQDGASQTRFAVGEDAAFVFVELIFALVVEYFDRVVVVLGENLRTVRRNRGVGLA